MRTFVLKIGYNIIKIHAKSQRTGGFKMKRLTTAVVILLVFIGFVYPAAAQTQGVTTAVSTTLYTRSITCTSTAQALTIPILDRRSIVMVNNDAAKTVYFGNKDVQLTTIPGLNAGIPIYSHESKTVDRTKAPIYCITSGADTVDLRYWLE
jgi:hypothetical protein